MLKSGDQHHSDHDKRKECPRIDRIAEKTAQLWSGAFSP
jgi:hypothetical protein